jgi:hypothetical protein
MMIGKRKNDHKEEKDTSLKRPCHDSEVNKRSRDGNEEGMIHDKGCECALSRTKRILSRQQYGRSLICEIFVSINIKSSF